MSTNELKLCTCCHADITSLPAETERCPHCSAKLKKATSSFYSSPDYLCRQKDSLLKELELGKLYPGDSKYDQRAAAISNEMVRWARSCPDEDRVNTLNDAVIILREIIHSDASTDTLRAVVGCAKRLAKLAENIEAYFRDGGSPYDREIRLISPEFRDDAGGTSATATGRRD